MKQILLTTIAFLAISLSFAQKTDANPKFDIENLEESSKEQLKKFLKIPQGNTGWFNAFIKSLYSEGLTDSRRGQVSNYLWYNNNYVAFHFFTYGGGSNVHYMACVNQKGDVVSLKKVMVQNLQNDNYFNVERHGKAEILCTNETSEMHLSNGGKPAKDKTYVSAVIYGISKEGKLTKRAFK